MKWRDESEFSEPSGSRVGGVLEVSGLRVVKEGIPLWAQIRADVG